MPLNIMSFILVIQLTLIYSSAIKNTAKSGGIFKLVRAVLNA